jgi:molecular chaperone DnaK (HSP70)
MDLFKKYIPLENVKKDSKISKNQIDKVVLLIGSTLFPKIQKMAQEFFKEKNKKKY